MIRTESNPRHVVVTVGSHAIDVVCFRFVLGARPAPALRVADWPIGPDEVATRAVLALETRGLTAEKVRAEDAKWAISQVTVPTESDDYFFYRQSYSSLTAAQKRSYHEAG